MAARIPDEKCLKIQNSYVVQNAAGYHPVQVLPSRADGAPLTDPRVCTVAASSFKREHEV